MNDKKLGEQPSDSASAVSATGLAALTATVQTPFNETTDMGKQNVLIGNKAHLVFEAPANVLSLIKVKRLIRVKGGGPEAFDDSISKLVALSEFQQHGEQMTAVDDFTIDLPQEGQDPFAVLEIGYRLQSGLESRDLFISLPRDVMFNGSFEWSSAIPEAHLGLVIFKSGAEVKLPATQVQFEIDSYQGQGKFKSAFDLQTQLAGQLDLTLHRATGSLDLDYSGAQGATPPKPEPVTERPPKGRDAVLTQTYDDSPVLCHFTGEEFGRKGKKGLSGKNGNPGFVGGHVTLHLRQTQNFNYQINVDGGPGGEPGPGGDGGPGGFPGDPVFKIFPKGLEQTGAIANLGLKLDTRRIVDPKSDLAHEKCAGLNAELMCYAFTDFPPPQGEAGEPGDAGSAKGPQGPSGVACLEQQGPLDCHSSSLGGFVP